MAVAGPDDAPRLWQTIGFLVVVAVVSVVTTIWDEVRALRGLFALRLVRGIVAVPDDVAVLWSAEETCPVGEQT